MEKTQKEDLKEGSRSKLKLAMIVLVVILLGTLIVTTSVVVYKTTNLPNINIEEPQSEGTATVALNILPPEGKSP